jgi:NitT/TauT family transport system substrate-binding protein
MKLLIAAALGLSLGASALADTLKVASGQRGAWDTTVAEWGQRKGFFKEQGLDLEIVFTSGSGETQQAVTSGSVDVGVAVGTIGVIGAVAQGAPIKIISSVFIGCPDLFWYVRGNSPIKSFKDAADKSVAFSTVGASTHLISRKLVEQAGVPAKLVATGSPSATLTMVMSGQIDIGWSFPPFGFAFIDRGDIRIVGRGSDVPELANQTVRTLIAHAGVLTSRRDAIVRFMKAYQKTMDWMYGSDEALAWYAEANNVTLEQARRAVTQFEPRTSTRLGPITGLDISMQQAIEFKRITKPLSAEEVARMLDIIDPTKP